MTMLLTYKYRILPTKKQHTALLSILESQRQLYNGALEERIGCYNKTGKSRTFFDQIRALNEWRSEDEEASSLPGRLQRWTLKRLDDAFKGFFNRLKAKNGRAGYPRFRSKGRWNSFGFHEFIGINLYEKRLYFEGLPGGLRVHLHRKLPKTNNIKNGIKSCIFSKDHKGWSVCLQVNVCHRHRLSDRSIGIDVGINHLVTLSTGEHIPNIHITKRSERKLRKRQRALSRCKNHSKRRQKIRRQTTKCYSKIKNTRKTYLHQVSRDIINRHDLIAVERLNIKNLVQSKLARSICDV